MNEIKVLLIVCLVALLCSVGKAKIVNTPTLHKNWKSLHFVNDISSMKMSVTLVLKHSNLNKLDKVLLDVSTPGLKSYGKHLTIDEVNDLTRPSTLTYSTVYDWLKINNLAKKTTAVQGGSALKITATVSDFEDAFNTTFEMVTDGNNVKTRAGDYVLPKCFEGNVVAVFGMHGLPLPKNKFIQTKAVANGFQVTPMLLKTTYNVSGVKGSGSKTNRQAVGEYVGETFKASDNTDFFNQYVSGAKPEDSILYKVVGGKLGASSSLEPALDVEYIMGVSPGVLTEYWEYQQQDFCYDLQQFTAKILDTQDLPNVFSISYGWQGDLSTVGCQPAEVEAVEINFQKIGALGVSMIVASQDSGAACDSTTCWASWPGTSPYVTSVGATSFEGGQSGKPEMASVQFGSGGGFSTRFERSNAKWQDQVVNNYLASAKGLPPKSMYSQNGRACPDISALGENYQVIANGELQPHVGGTSASTPVFAAMVSLINEEREKQGKGSMGFLNPFIYANPQAFTDITQGSNKINRGGQPTEYGYDTAVGWDPVTGLGTPLFEQLLSAALKN